MKNFENKLSAAQALVKISAPPEDDFWSGYARGLRRTHHGENFGTEADHKLWLAAAESDDESRRLRGLGYRAGVNGCDVSAAMKKLSASLAGATGGSVKNKKKSAASRENGKKGGRPKKIK